MGASYVVTPASCHEMEAASDETDQSELNAQLFQGLCGALRSLDQGLVCSSNCNIETMGKAAFHCYYALQPSDNGPMLLRRLAASEEVLPIPDATRFVESSPPGEIETSIRNSLLKIASKDYNPLLHERGFHQKLSLLVKESLHFGSLPLKLKDTTFEPNATLPDSLEVAKQGQTNSQIDFVVLEEETLQQDPTSGEDINSACIAQEWEQLVVTEVPRKYSPTCTLKPKLDQSILSPPDSNKQIDIKTSRILERLEIPRQLKAKVVSPTIIGSSRIISDACMPAKKPLIPFLATGSSEQGVSSSQLMKPNFQRLKRKHK